MILLQLLAHGLVYGALYALVAVGFGLIYRTTKVFHLAHGAIYTSAAYCCYVLLVLLRWPMVLSVVVATLISAMLGVLVEVLVYAPLARRRASGLVGLLSALGLYVLIVNVLALVFNNEQKTLRPDLEAMFELGPVALTSLQLIQLATSALVLVSLIYFLRATTLGRLIRAVQNDANLAVVMGVDVGLIRVIVFAVGSALGGIASILSALDVGVEPHGGMAAVLIGAVALIVGGLRSIEGPVVGALLLAFTQSLVIWCCSARWSEAMTFVLLIAFLIFRPQGLLGKRRRVEEPST